MATNPLASHFRQPKIFISLPSKGVYNKNGTIEGDPTNLAVYGMTGMDEIISKTPDALMTGQATIDVVKSCLPAVKDPWDLSVLDTDLVFSSIRIATYGNFLHVANTCSSCEAENEYDVDLAFIVDHFTKLKYNNTLNVDNLIIRTRPINYKQLTELNVKNFEMQQTLKQADSIEDQEEKQKFINDVWKELADSQNKLYIYSVESVEVDGTVVTERGHIIEWLENCDQKIIDALQTHLQENRTSWTMPSYKVKCNSCNHEDSVILDLDQSNFFDRA